MLPIDLRKPAGDPLRVLCLGAHSDDVEIGAGGLVRRLVREAPEVEVDWYVFTAAGPRADEARESAAWFTEGAAAARVETLDYRESFFPEHWAEIKERLFEIRQATSPDVVLSHRLEDRHQDHRVLAELTWNTFRDHVVLEYEIPKYEGDLGQPNVFAPLTRADAEAKADAVVRFFASQRGKQWFDAAALLGLMRLRGLECSAPEGYAEAFHARKLTL
ncbi:MAG: PIG-L deacetylase family protein [Planctomycetota bacterium]